MMLIERQVIVSWYKPEEKLPPAEWDTVICTVSGRAGNVIFDHAVEMMSFDKDSGWWSYNYDFDELTVHAWCDLKAYKG